VKIQELIQDLEKLAEDADHVAGVQSEAGFNNDSAVAYWSGAKMAYKKAAKLLREAK
jgi:hypothetical protein